MKLLEIKSIITDLTIEILRIQAMLSKKYYKYSLLSEEDLFNDQSKSSREYIYFVNLKCVLAERIVEIEKTIGIEGIGIYIQGLCLNAYQEIGNLNKDSLKKKIIELSIETPYQINMESITIKK